MLSRDTNKKPLGLSPRRSDIPYKGQLNQGSQFHHDSLAKDGIDIIGWGMSDYLLGQQQILRGDFPYHYSESE